MKTLKKTLCLILAVVMVVGVLILPAYAADDYTAAITALQNYKVLQGKGDGLIHADDPVTRADMAAIVYRIMTGDTEPAATANQKAAAKYGAYADKFKDLTANDQWAKGYIGFCANQGVLKGDEKGNVKPNQQITGYEVQAMLLRALGYDRNNEYTGSNWEYKVLADATKAGISKGVSTDPAAMTPRGAVAQLTYNAAINAKRVAPSVYPNVGYNLLGESLIEATSSKTYDVWGAPSTKYDLTFTWPDIDVETHPVVADKPLATYYAPVTECDVADDLGIKTGDFTTYTNGYGNKGTQHIDALDTTHKIGAQGRYIAVYDATPDSKDTPDTIVYIDTVLAKVTGVTAATYDTNGHEITPATTTVTVYGNANMEGIPADPNTIKNYPGNAATNTNKVYKIAGTYTMDQLLLVNILTGTAQNAINTGNDPVDPSTGRAATVRALNAKAVTQATVTVAAITRDGDVSGTSQNIVGFVGTNGVKYLYDVSYGYYDGASAKTTLQNTDIGKSFTVYTDGRNNVVGLVPAATDKGVGVVTTYKLVGLDSKTGINRDYVIDYSILTATGATITVRAANDKATGAPYDGETAALTAAEANVNKLVKFAPNATNSKYCDVVAATNTDPNIASIEIGDADALVSGSNGALVNDNTVFFVGNYQLDNSLDNGSGAYKLTNYSVYTGFQNLPKDLKNGNVEIFEGEKKVDPKPTTLQWYAFSGAATPTEIKSDTSAAYAKYVLVLYGTETSNNVVEPVSSYAYVQYKENMYETYQNYFQFDALMNGANSPLRLNSVAFGVVTTQTTGGAGLYTYADPDSGVNGAYATVKKVNRIPTSNITWEYNAGVLDLKSAFSDGLNGDNSKTPQYLTVTKDAQIYIVNPSTGSAYKFSGTMKDVQTVYGTKADGSSRVGVDMYFQLNQYGWVNFVYVIDNMEGGAAPTPDPVYGAPVLTNSGRDVTAYWKNTTAGSVSNVRVDIQYRAIGAKDWTLLATGTPVSPGPTGQTANTTGELPAPGGIQAGWEVRAVLYVAGAAKTYSETITIY